jgi:RNA polymerase sigma-70 factor (ECF subfamily)
MEESRLTRRLIPRVKPGGEISPEVLDACGRGDREAQRALYDAYKDRVYSIAFYYLHGDDAGAADVTQQVFLKLMNGISTYRGGANFSTWLYRIVVNACVDHTRRRRTGHTTEPAVLTAIADPARSHEDLFAQREIAESVRLAIASLPPKLRLTVLLRYVEGLAYTEMAATLGCSMGTVASRLSRAHRLLAQRLAPLKALVQKE